MAADLRQKERRAAEALGSALGKLGKEEINLAEATRKKALEELETFNTRLALQNKMIGLTERDRILAQVDVQLGELKLKGLKDEDLVVTKKLLTQDALKKLHEREVKFLGQFLEGQEDSNDLTEDQVEMTNKVLENIRQADEAQRKSQQAMFLKIVIEDLADSDTLEVGSEEAVKKIEDMVRDSLDKTKRQADDAAGNIARSFMDTFIQVVQAGKGEGGFLGALQALFATLGKEVLQAALKEMILTMVTNKKLLAEAGNKTVGEMLFGQVKSIFGSGGGANKTPLDDSAAKLDTSAGNLDIAATALRDAAALLNTGAGTNFGKIGEMNLIPGAEDDDFNWTPQEFEQTRTQAAGLQDFGGAMSSINQIMAMFGEGDGIFSKILGVFSQLPKLFQVFEWIPKIFGAIGGIFGFAKGGMVFPKGAIQSFQHGGIVRNGPVLATVAEEGPELVARMKPARKEDKEGEKIEQRIILVDERPRGRLGPNDIVKVISGDMARGGETSNAILHVLRRHGGVT